MFFPERIKSIKKGDKVLEIGPGATPYHRSDVFLELKYDSDEKRIEQSGYVGILKTDKPVVYYDGSIFPFADNEFDYVICSHVLEHVSDIESFFKEMFRVAKKGYIEYPLIYYDYVYNIPEHVTFLKFNRGLLFYLPKSMTSLSEFSDITWFFYESLKAGHKCLIDSLKDEIMEGFEWYQPFQIERAKKISDVCWENIKIHPPIIEKPSFISKLKCIVKRVLSC